VVFAGAWVILENEPAEGAQMVNVIWNGKAVMILAADLQQHAVQWQDEATP
jgi:hypothetical protein